jgi:hypothetical protein
MLWLQEEPTRPPCGWEPNKQQPREFTDIMPALSQFLARSSYSYWEESRKANASLNRGTALRGIGNAIVPQVAAEFIKGSL